MYLLGVVYKQRGIRHELREPRLTSITPAAQRQWYLYDKIREFCPVADRDVTCPLPSVPMQAIKTPGHSRATSNLPHNPLPRDHKLVVCARRRDTAAGRALGVHSH